MQQQDLFINGGGPLMKSSPNVAATMPTTSPPSEVARLSTDGGPPSTSSPNVRETMPTTALLNASAGSSTDEGGTL